MIQTAAFATFVGLLIWRGFFAAPGFATWHMFVTTRRVQFDLEVSRDGGPWKPFNPWDHLPHSGIAMDQQGAEVFLAYLRAFHDLDFRGSLTVIENDVRSVVTIEPRRNTRMGSA